MFSFQVLTIFILLSGFTHACPDVCRCSGNVVDCSHRGLKSIPSGIPRTTHTLLLHHNQITSLASEYNQSGRRLLALRNLDLSFNNLTSIPDYQFENSPALETLNLDHNQIAFEDRVFVEPFGGLEATLTRLSASHNLLAGPTMEYTFGYLHSLEYLDLSYNRFTSVDFLSMPESLVHLDLSYNDINSLTSSSFPALRKLQFLDLRSLAMQEMQITIFRDLESLTELRLGGLRLSSLTQSLFRGLASLMTLQIVDSAISTLPVTLLQHCPNLTSLDMSNNQLSTFPIQFLSFAPSLLTLNLAENELEEASHLAVRLDSSELTSLNLSSNRIRGPIAGLVFAPTKLQFLDLAVNQITSLDESLSSATLRTLNLASNSISSVDSAAFQACPALESVDLSGNPLLSLPDIELDRNLRVSLGRNSWNCNCTFLNFFLAVMRDSSKLQLECNHVDDLSCMTCASPSQFEGSYIGDLAATDFGSCEVISPPEAHSDAATVAIVAVVACLLSVAVLVVLALIWYKRDALRRLAKRGVEGNNSSSGDANPQNHGVGVYAGFEESSCATGVSACHDNQYSMASNAADAQNAYEGADDVMPHLNHLATAQKKIENEYKLPPGLGVAPTPENAYVVPTQKIENEYKFPTDLGQAPAPENAYVYPDQKTEDEYKFPPDLGPPPALENAYVYPDQKTGDEYKFPQDLGAASSAENAYDFPKSLPASQVYEIPMNQKRMSTASYVLPEVTPEPTLKFNAYEFPLSPEQEAEVTSSQQSPYMDLK